MKARILIGCFLCLVIGVISPIEAIGNEKTEASRSDPESLVVDKQVLEKLDEALTAIGEQKRKINDLRIRSEKAEDMRKNVFNVRLDKAMLGLLRQGVDFADAVAAHKEAGDQLQKYRQAAKEVLASQPKIAESIIQRLSERIVLPNAEASAADRAAAFTKVFLVLDLQNEAYELFAKSLRQAKELGRDVSTQETLLKESLAERAANGSVLLEMAMDNVTALRAGVTALPDDAELKAKLTVATNHVRSLAGGLESVLALMDALEMDTADYRELTLVATGQITTDVFEVGVVTNLLVGWGQTLWNSIIEEGPDLVFKIFLFLLIVYVFRKLANIVQKVAEGALAKSHLQFSELLRRMVVSIVRNIVIVLGILIALSQVGISLGPLLAGLGVVGFVVGFALQDSLSNFASGLMILMYRPFDVGDLIEAGGVSGKVSHMSLVNTTVMTLDNQTIVLPNKMIWGDVIKNVTAQTRRRIDMVFGISYSDDIEKAERVLQEIVDTHEGVLSDPEPIVRLHELADSSVNFIVRPWVDRDDYWEVYWDITRSVKMRFDAEGISIPFPQQDVHMHNVSPA